MSTTHLLEALSAVMNLDVSIPRALAITSATVVAYSVEYYVVETCADGLALGCGR